MKYIIILIITIGISACANTVQRDSTPGSNPKDKNSTVESVASQKQSSMTNLVADYQIIDPRAYNPALYSNAPDQNSDCHNKDYKDADKILDKKRCWLNYLPNSEDFVFIKRISSSASGEFLTSAVSVEGESYQIVSNWMRYFHSVPTSEKEGGAKASISGDGHYIGVGARIIANVTTYEAGLNLSDLFSVAASASAETKKVQGSLLFTIQGIHGKGVDTYTPKISKLDIENLNRALESIVSIKTLLHNDKDISITPQVLAYKIERSQEDVIVSTDEKSGDQRQGWVYLGHFDEDTGKQRNISNIKIDSTFNVINLTPGDVVESKAELSARAGYPTFPNYNLKQIIGTVPINTDMTINSIQVSGFGKFWALVTWTG